MPDMLTALLIVAIVLLVLMAVSIRVVQQYERGVTFVLGRVKRDAVMPGVALIIPPIMRLEKVSLRLEAMDVPKQDVITRDNVPVRVNAVVFFRVVDPVRAVVDVKNYVQVTSQKAQTTLRSVLGTEELDGLLTEREQINVRLQEILTREMEPLGLKIDSVEVKDVELPEGMQRAMARQAEAERERRAKVISAQGDLEAAEQTAAAAAILDQHQSALQLRYLQTLTEISAEHNSTILFPLPIDLLKGFLPRTDRPGDG